MNRIAVSLLVLPLFVAGIAAAQTASRPPASEGGLTTFRPAVPLDPSIWNIGWTRGTRILAVLVSGYHRQVVAGLEPQVPTLQSTFSNKGECGFFHSVQANQQ
jgi:hypothetical protein